MKSVIYRIPILSNLVRKVLTSAAPSEFTTVKITGGLLKGAKLHLDLKKEKYYWLGSWELDLQNTIKELIKPGMVIYDIGANIGFFSILFANLVGERGHVFAFEPLPGNLSRLEKNIVLNNLNEKITTVAAAVSDNIKREVFFIHESHGMGKLSGSGGRDANYRSSLSVQSMSIDHFVYREMQKPPDVIKMDIEGGEVKALPGMLNTLKEHRPIMFIEIHGAEAAEVMWTILKDCSYEIKQIQRGYPQIQALDKMEWKEHVIAIPN